MFCCYRMPNDEIKWYFYDAENDEVIEDVRDIWPEIRCDIDTERYTEEGPAN